MQDNPQREHELRQRLGIPENAQKILIFGETSHWDPNWLYTTEEYYTNHIYQIMDVAIKELIRDEKRVYSLECVFFLKMYWDRCPERRSTIRDYINNGRLRLTGSGMTTPDTTLPEAEAILRDYLRGQAWLKENGMNQEPRLAYFPDGFGHSPGVPSMLSAAGFDYCAITRIDGMNFPATDYRRRWYYPRPGSNAWLLLKELKTLDFVWRSPDRSQVLTHWNPFTYFQGDNLVYIGPIKWMGKLYGFTRRSEAHVARRIHKHVKRLGPLSPTPYLFCPIGMDFNRPIHNLGDLIDRYNWRYYPETGTYVVLAALDDYLDLVSCHGSKIPALQLDFNPYWMGFYSTRPRLKQRIKNLTRDLLKTEKLSLLVQTDPERKKAVETLPDLTVPWDQLILSNHHDYITGTSPDRVYVKEQKTFVTQARVQVKKALHHVLSRCDPPPVEMIGEAPKFLKKSGRFTIETPFYKVELDEKRGACFTSWIEKTTGREMLTGLGNDLVLHRDTGGLWRLGHEFAGGRFQAIDRVSLYPSKIETSVEPGILELTMQSTLGRKRFIRHLWFRNDSPIVRMKVDGSLPTGRTLTVRFATVLSPRFMHMDVPGAVVNRPFQKDFNPTFWPAKSFAHIKEQESDRGLAVGLYCPATISGDSTGVVEWIAMRNAPKETAYWFLPVLAHPATGYEMGDQWLDYAVWFTSQGDWRDNRIPLKAEEALQPTWLLPQRPNRDFLANSLVTTDNELVIVNAVKSADIGSGIIVRLYSHIVGKETALLIFRNRTIQEAWLCNARETDLEKLEIKDGKALVPLAKSIRTIRLRLA